MSMTTQLFDIPRVRTHVRRSRFELRMDILGQIASGRTRPTHIMFGANLSWRVFSDELSPLLDNGLVSKESIGERTTYSLTEKGKDAFGLYYGAKDLCQSRDASTLLPKF